MKNKTILITGINGFLGSHLAKRLADKCSVIGLDINIDNLFRIEELGVKVYDAQEGNFETIFRENEIFAVIHAATVYKRENEPIEKLLNTNILLPLHLITLADNHKVPLFINTDSFFNRENSQYSYLADYTLSKRHSLEWLKMKKGSCQLVSMKIHHMYGPDDAAGKFVPFIISALKSNQSQIELTGGEQKRDFIYIDDVTAAYETVLANHALLTDEISEIEVGNGKSIALKELIITIKELTHSTTELRFGALPYREGEIMEDIADNSKLMKLGWRPEVNLEQGLTFTIDFKTITR